MGGHFFLAGSLFSIIWDFLLLSALLYGAYYVDKASLLQGLQESCNKLENELKKVNDIHECFKQTLEKNGVVTEHTIETLLDFKKTAQMLVNAFELANPQNFACVIAGGVKTLTDLKTQAEIRKNEIDRLEQEIEKLRAVRSEFFDITAQIRAHIEHMDSNLATQAELNKEFESIMIASNRFHQDGLNLIAQAGLNGRVENSSQHFEPLCSTCQQIFARRMQSFFSSLQARLSSSSSIVPIQPLSGVNVIQAVD